MVDANELYDLTDHPDVLSRLQDDVGTLIDKTGIYFRIFGRIKSGASIAEKLVRKGDKYGSGGFKMQDLLGIRIVLYYLDDIEICRNILRSHFHLIERDSQVDMPESNDFSKVRMNLIFRLPRDMAEAFPDKLWADYPIDRTFEVQIRTTFSEGYHEVEHEVRYKHEQEWTSPSYYTYSRLLNSIYATLEMCDSTIIRVLDDLAHAAYMEGDVEKMLRYKFRIRMENEHLTQPLLDAVHSRTIRQNIYLVDRAQFLSIISNSALLGVPLTADNIVLICGNILFSSKRLADLTPPDLAGQITAYKNRRAQKRRRR